MATASSPRAATGAGGGWMHGLVHNFFKNPMWKHGDKKGFTSASGEVDSMEMARVGGVTSKLSRKGTSGKSQAPGEMKSHSGGNHVRSYTSSTSSLSGSVVNSAETDDRHKAPSSTVGTQGLQGALIAPAAGVGSSRALGVDESDVMPWINRSEQQIPQGAGGVVEGAAAPVVIEPTDMDTELGYPASTIVSYWRAKESDPKKQIKNEPTSVYISNRRFMVDWVSEIGEELRLQPVTVHSAISFLDEVTLKGGYSPKNWQLQAVCCLSVAAKYEEAERNMPMVSEIAHATELKLTTAMVTAGELQLAQNLEWDVSRVTAMHFLGYYLHHGVTFKGDECQGRGLFSKMERYIRKYVEFFANLCQQDYGFHRYLPSTVAAASILAARRALSMTPLWRPELEALTGCSHAAIYQCSEELWNFYEIMFPTHQPLRTVQPTGASTSTSTSTTANTSTNSVQNTGGDAHSSSSAVASANEYTAAPLATVTSSSSRSLHAQTSTSSSGLHMEELVAGVAAITV